MLSLHGYRRHYWWNLGCYQERKACRRAETLFGWTYRFPFWASSTAINPGWCQWTAGGRPLESTRVLLDTHTLLWVDCNDPKLGAMARLQIEITWTCFLESFSETLGIFVEPGPTKQETGISLSWRQPKEERKQTSIWCDTCRNQWASFTSRIIKHFVFTKGIQ